ncbi:hypothetical protein D1007_12785 [Hordeum vulgare]|nr:hypothetical protein D1007_12785 [Hordeum vulgare]
MWMDEGTGVPFSSAGDTLSSGSLGLWRFQSSTNVWYCPSSASSMYLRLRSMTRDPHLVGSVCVLAPKQTLQVMSSHSDDSARIGYLHYIKYWRKMTLYASWSLFGQSRERAGKQFMRTFFSHR